MPIFACSICGARPWGRNFGVRETFSLRRLTAGKPSDNPAVGDLFCEKHIPANDREQDGKPGKQSRASLTAPEAIERLKSEVLTGESEIEREIAALGDRDDLERGSLEQALRVHCRRLGQSIAALEKTLKEARS